MTSFMLEGFWFGLGFGCLMCLLDIISEKYYQKITGVRLYSLIPLYKTYLFIKLLLTIEKGKK
jgi:hypothetical protein